MFSYKKSSLIFALFLLFTTAHHASASTFPYVYVVMHVNFGYQCVSSTEDTVTICFNDMTIGGTLPYFAYAWNFGDGQFSIQKDPCHTFYKSQNITQVIHRVTDANCMDPGAYAFIDLNTCERPVLTQEEYDAYGNPYNNWPDDGCIYGDNPKPRKNPGGGKKPRG